MKIEETVNQSYEVLVEICKQLGYEEFRTTTVNLVKSTPVGRVHIVLRPTNKRNKTIISIHHDIFGDKEKDHYTKLSDGTARKVWDQIQNKLYDMKKEKLNVPKEVAPCM